jgi:lamin tail-like protein
MVFINEWLPNPVGPDATAEFIELYNNGNRSVDLEGWKLETGKGKKFSLAGHVIVPGAYLVLDHAETKLSLANTDGALALYNASGILIDEASFAGAAPEGKSFSRINYAPTDIGHFAFVDPTPGALNKTINNEIAARKYPTNTPLNQNLDTSGFLAIMMGTAVVMSGLIIYVIKSHEALSKQFFGRDEKTGP